MIKMSDRITPNWSDLIEKTDDELREILSELNAQSLRYLAKSMVQVIIEHRDYVKYQEEEKTELFHRLNKIVEIAGKR
jgi:hypothetical protein